MIVLKTEQDLQGLRRAAGVVGAVLAEAAARVAPGVATIEIDRVAEQMMNDAGARSAFKGYRPGRDYTPFPNVLCISVNDVVVHGIPGSYVLQEGDIVTVDCGVELDGYFGDFAYTFPVGEISDANRALLDATKQSLYEGVAAAVSGNRIGDIGHAVQSYCEARGYGVVRDLVGHGIGRRMHEEPQVPNTGYQGRGKKLREGMTMCIEPMINRGTGAVRVDADGWTVRSADGLPSAHYEHMIAVQRGRPEILSSYDGIEAALARARGEAAPAAAHV